MMFTERALAAHIITQAEADEVENWIDEQVKTNQSVTVPDHLQAIWERVYLFTNTQGGMQ
jgi:hypothetical protein